MENSIIISNANKAIHQIADIFSTEVAHNSGEYVFGFPIQLGDGYIKGMDFTNGLTLFCLEGTFTDDFNLTFTENRNQSLMMVFCMDGNMELHKTSQNHLGFQPLQSLITVINPGSQYRLKIPEGVKANCHIIIIGEKEFLRLMGDSTDEYSLLLREMVNSSVEYDFRYSIAAMDIFQEIKKSRFSGALNKIYTEGKVLEVVSHQLKQYIDESGPFSNLDMLRKKDIQKMLEAKEILLSDLQKPPVIKELARLIGTNENKLKRGFKQMFGKTITNFIIDKRLEQARILLADDQWSIKEISERTGYQSSSAFTKVFKKKFGITPKQFLKRHDSR